MNRKQILIVAGEASGDLHAAPVVHKLKELDAGITFFGSGGALMKSEGVELLAGIDDLAVMGFSSVPRMLPRLRRLKQELVRRVRQQNVGLVILVDYPGFNLNLAQALKQLPNPPLILEYIAPQVWAWRAGRIKKIRRVVDQLAVVFPFEEELFRAAQVPVTFVGHPLLDELDLTDRLVEGIPSSPLLALLPGSRPGVAIRHLATFAAAARGLTELIPGLRIGVGKAATIDAAFLEPILNRIPNGQLYTDSRELLSQATAAIVCSGTATLEAALLGTPQVVVYKTSELNYQIIKRLIKLPYVAMVNIVAGRQVVPELLQHNFTADGLIKTVRPLLESESDRHQQLSAFAEIRQVLGGSGAAARVANLAYNMLSLSAKA